MKLEDFVIGKQYFIVKHSHYGNDFNGKIRKCSGYKEGGWAGQDLLRFESEIGNQDFSVTQTELDVRKAIIIPLPNLHKILYT